MKKQNKLILFITIIFFALTSFNPLLAEETGSAGKPSFFQKAKKWFSGSSRGNTQKIRELQEEIQMREKALVDMDKFMTDAVADARPRCAGGTVTVSITDDPRDEIRTEIFELQHKITALQE